MRADVETRLARLESRDPAGVTPFYAAKLRGIEPECGA